MKKAMIALVAGFVCVWIAWAIVHIVGIITGV